VNGNVVREFIIMRSLVILSVGVFAFSAVAIGAQAVPKEYAEMAAAMQAAQARAVKPGDDALGCPALEKELVASMNDPAIQAYAGKSAAAAQKNATAADKSKPPMSPQAAAALAAAFGAGGGLPPGLAAGYAAQSQAAQKLQAEQMKQMIPIMPQMMRSQRIIQLAAVKQCAWMFGAAPFAPPVPVR
jgi:hypothetical protein